MQPYEIDALDEAGIYIRRGDNTNKWIMYINGISRGHFDNREIAEDFAIDIAYDMLSESAGFCPDTDYFEG